MPLMRLLVILPTDPSLTTLRAAQLCKETAATVSKSLKKTMTIPDVVLMVDCVDDPIDAIVRCQDNYTVLVAPVLMKEHGLELCEFVEIVRDLDCNAAIYYYRDALAERHDVDLMQRHLDDAQKTLSSVVPIELLYPRRRVPVKMVQGEVTDPTVPTITAHCKTFLDDCMYDSLSRSRADWLQRHISGGGEKGPPARQVTVDEDSSDKTSSSSGQSRCLSDDGTVDVLRYNYREQLLDEMGTSLFEENRTSTTAATVPTSGGSSSRHVPPEMVPPTRTTFYPTVSIITGPISGPTVSGTDPLKEKTTTKRSRRPTPQDPPPKEAAKTTKRSRRTKKTPTTKKKDLSKDNVLVWDPTQEEILIDDDTMQLLTADDDNDNILAAIAEITDDIDV